MPEELKSESLPETQPAPEAPVSVSKPEVVEPKTSLEAMDQALKPVEKPEKIETEKVVEKQETLELEPEKPKAEKPKEPEVQKPENLYEKPEGLTERSERRFAKLVDSNKTLTTKNEELNQTFTGFQQILTETQTTPDDLAKLLEYNRLVKSGDLDGALAILDEQRAYIATFTNRKVPGVDLLQGHPDLAQEVQEERLAEERALEIARARSQQKINEQTRFQQQQAQLNEANEKARKDKAIEAITKFAQNKAATDIDYKAKEARLLPLIEKVAGKFPPELWLEQLTMLYETIGAEPAAGTNNPRPLRPQGGSAGGPQPKSTLEAMNQALGYGN